MVYSDQQTKHKDIYNDIKQISAADPTPEKRETTMTNYFIMNQPIILIVD